MFFGRLVGLNFLYRANEQILFLYKTVRHILYITRRMAVHREWDCGTIWTRGTLRSCSHCGFRYGKYRNPHEFSAESIPFNVMGICAVACTVQIFPARSVTSLGFHTESALAKSLKGSFAFMRPPRTLRKYTQVTLGPSG